MFEFVVREIPFSVNNVKKQALKHRLWQAKVLAAAMTQWQQDARAANHLPLSVPLEVSITTYFTELKQDVDNVIKPILDAISVPESKRKSPFAQTGHLIFNDDLVYKVTSERVDLKASTESDLPSSKIVVQAIADGISELVHIVLDWEESEE